MDGPLRPGPDRLELEFGSSGECIDMVTVAPAVVEAYEESCITGDQHELMYLHDFKITNVYYSTPEQEFLPGPV